MNFHFLLLRILIIEAYSVDVCSPSPSKNNEAFKAMNLPLTMDLPVLPTDGSSVSVYITGFLFLYVSILD